jgi:hypothetical protein
MRAIKQGLQARASITLPSFRGNTTALLPAARAGRTAARTIERACLSLPANRIGTSAQRSEFEKKQLLEIEKKQCLKTKIYRHGRVY